MKRKKKKEQKSKNYLTTNFKNKIEETLRVYNIEKRNQIIYYILQTYEHNDNLYRIK